MIKRLQQDNEGIDGEQCTCNDEGKFPITVDEKLIFWQSHYKKLWNEGFSWDIGSWRSCISNGKIKAEKAAGSSGKTIKMIKAADDFTFGQLTPLFNCTIQEGAVPEG